ncbi:MAG TPA: preprotein translocase subunit SecE [Candidatus Azoamicus sp.]
MKNYKIQKNILIKIILLLALLTLINIFIQKKIFMLIIISIVIIISTIILFKNRKSELTELKSEIKSISWPDKKEVNQSMITVTLIIISASLVIWLIDSILTFFISKVI